MYTKATITNLLIAAGFAVHGVTANVCAIVGPGVAYCREHPDPNSAVVKTLSVDSLYDYGCRWPYGVNVDGDSGWDLNSDLACWVWEVRTDDNCCPSEYFLPFADM
ncbi:hypothetical protein N431DRAFT_461059 [Stipitochalara longipes BDJ]|nr:hypothetical protein N431DRAFT_461059 [Stipitochalara longipes BDJ]